MDKVTEADDGQKGDQGGWWCSQTIFFISEDGIVRKSQVNVCRVTRPECPEAMKGKVKDKGRRSSSEKNNLQSMFPIFGLQDIGDRGRVVTTRGMHPL